MADEPYKRLKLAALERDPQLGVPPHLLGPDNLVLPSARPAILNDVHTAHRAYMASLSRTRDYVPHFFNRQAVSGLLGVEGFLMPGRLASFNTPSDSKYTGVLQFGAAAFHHHASAIAARLNDMMKDPAMHGTTLAQQIHDKKIEFPFTRDNVWAVHRHPVAQLVGAAIHTSGMHPKIDNLIQQGKINPQQGNALFTIAHNIPALAQMISSSLAVGVDKPTNAKEVNTLKQYMETNPALYRDTTSLRGILDKVAAYATQKGQGVERIASGAQPVQRAQPPEGQTADNRSELTRFIANLLQQEQQKREISERDRQLLTKMIEEIQRQPIDQTRRQAPPQPPPQIATAPRPAPLPAPTVRSAQPPALPVVAARQPVPRKHVSDAYVPPAHAPSTLGAQHERIQAAKRPVVPVQTAAQIEDAREREIVRRAQERQPIAPATRDLPPRPPADIPSVPPKRAKGIVTNSIS